MRQPWRSRLGSLAPRDADGLQTGALGISDAESNGFSSSSFCPSSTGGRRAHLTWDATPPSAPLSVAVRWEHFRKGVPRNQLLLTYSDNHSLHAKAIMSTKRRRTIDEKPSAQGKSLYSRSSDEALKHPPTTRVDPPRSRPRAEPVEANPRLGTICADSGNHSARFEQSRGTAGQGRAVEGTGRCGQCHRRCECPRPSGSDDRCKRAAAIWDRAHLAVDVPRPQPNRTTKPVARGCGARHHEYFGTAGR